MKKVYLALGMAACMSVSSVGVMAETVANNPWVGSQVAPEGAMNTSALRLNMKAPITRAEFIIAMMSTVQAEYPQLMDTHYAAEPMRIAETLGLIDLDVHGMETWDDILTEDEKMDLLGKAMQNQAFDMEKVYEKLTSILVDTIAVNDEVIDFEGAQLKHYKGHLMVPLRPVAEAMGFGISWDPALYTATLTQGSVIAPIQVGFDAYGYTDTEAETQTLKSLGVTPILRDDMMYVPVAGLHMFATTELVANTLYIDVIQ